MKKIQLDLDVIPPNSDHYLREDLEALENNLAAKNMLHSGYAMKEIRDYLLKYLKSKLDISKEKIISNLSLYSNNSFLGDKAKVYANQLFEFLKNELKRLHSGFPNIERAMDSLLFEEKANSSIKTTIEDINHKIRNQKKERFLNTKGNIFSYTMNAIISFFISLILGKTF